MNWDVRADQKAICWSSNARHERRVYALLDLTFALSAITCSVNAIN